MGSYNIIEKNDSNKALGTIRTECRKQKVNVITSRIRPFTSRARAMNLPYRVPRTAPRTVYLRDHAYKY